MLFRSLNALMAALFVFAAALQYNDPDPLRWMVIYIAAAVPCLLALRGRAPWRLATAVGLVALAWSASHLPHVLRHGRVGEMFDQWKMTNEDVVYGRELFGLLIIAIWMGVVVWQLRRAGAGSPAGVPRSSQH